jgi:hypothetical protein
MRSLGFLLLFVTTSVAFCDSPCASTPEAALRAYAGNLMNDVHSGFRVVRVRTDAPLGVTFADMERCDHPGWPGVSLSTQAVTPTAATRRIVAPSASVVRAGEMVRAWRRESNAHIEMAAVSDDGGAIGDRIRLHGATSNGEPVRYYFGVVRGPYNVELE